MKYIIEIEEMPFISEGSEMQLFKATEFNSLVFDRNGLEKLTPYDESAAEQRGWEEAWELITAIGKMSDDDMVDCFGARVIVDLSYTEAREKYEAWKEQKDIKVGDEVSFAGNVFVVTRINDPDTIPDTISGIGKNGETFGMKDKKKWHKTGRTFPEVTDLLEKMRKPE